MNTDAGSSSIAVRLLRIPDGHSRLSEFQAGMSKATHRHSCRGHCADMDCSLYVDLTRMEVVRRQAPGPCYGLLICISVNSLHRVLSA